MGVINHLNGTGHTATVWDPTDAAETAAAASEFLRLKGQGNLMVETAKGSDAKQVHSFNPNAEEIVAMRPLQGG